MKLSKETFAQVFRYATPANIDKYYQPLIDTIIKYEINTPERQAAFFAQLAHESGSLRYSQEIASGKAYEGRKDLGNTQIGDGVRFKGRGLIQLTGRANYQRASNDFGIDFIKNPELVEKPYYAAMIAGWFWDKLNLNLLADKQQLKAITRKINGGLNGYADRLKHYEIACKVLEV
jgi:putative chitinase